ncbi:hypothetical protein FF38_04506 [Lucilia cuprina]|uniref:Uncharacterized protein n=1 Tax=Lucilia cuprina TaxID=7375 RepID=A0A0L0BRK5_LUCCU|nr:hypothetical protein FF38_04506 [Lucilia cuprina]
MRLGEAKLHISLGAIEDKSWYKLTGIFAFLEDLHHDKAGDHGNMFLDAVKLHISGAESRVKDVKKALQYNDFVVTFSERSCGRADRVCFTMHNIRFALFVLTKSRPKKCSIDHFRDIDLISHSMIMPKDFVLFLSDALNREIIQISSLLIVFASRYQG